MRTVHLCDTCDQPIDLCDCSECPYCGDKIQGDLPHCDNTECEREHEESINEKLRGEVTENV